MYTSFLLLSSLVFINRIGSVHRWSSAQQATVEPHTDQCQRRSTCHAPRLGIDLLAARQVNLLRILISGLGVASDWRAVEALFAVACSRKYARRCETCVVSTRFPRNSPGPQDLSTTPARTLAFNRWRSPRRAVPRRVNGAHGSLWVHQLFSLSA